MKKHTLLFELNQIKNDTELKEIEQGTMLKILILLVDYINDPQIKEAVDDIPC